MLSVRILISAGEASGEMYGALLIEGLRRLAGESPAATLNQKLQFFGVGGDRMRAAGCDTVVDARDLAVVGISEILGHLPKIWGLFHRLIAAGVVAYFVNVTLKPSGWNAVSQKPVA